jgi:rubrerythrin
MSETLKNLTKAFIGESQARNRYTIYGKQAKKDGYPELEEIFNKTAENEREHAKWLFRMINQIKENDDEIIVDADAITILGDTADNLKSAIEGETFEAEEMYPEFADVAEKEGYSDIAARLRSIGKAEEHHEARFKDILSKVENKTFFKKDKEVTWECRKCAYTSKGQEPPAKCPSCDHPTEYFEVLCEKF